MYSLVAFIGPRIFHLPWHSTGLLPPKKDYRIFFNFFPASKISPFPPSLFYLISKIEESENNWLPKHPTGFPWPPSSCPTLPHAIKTPLDWALSVAFVYCFLSVSIPHQLQHPEFCLEKLLPSVAWVVSTSLPRPEWILTALGHSKWPLSWPQWLVQGWTHDPSGDNEISMETPKN